MPNGEPTTGRMASFNIIMVEILRDNGAVVHIADKYNYETGSRYETTQYRAQRLTEEIEKFLIETKPESWNEKTNGKWV